MVNFEVSLFPVLIMRSDRFAKEPADGRAKPHQRPRASTSPDPLEQ